MKAKWIGFVAVCAVLGGWTTARAFPPPLGLYVKPIGSSKLDSAYGVGVDAGGNSYITGFTWGDLGGPNLGETDAFIVACNSAWGTRWTRQIGTTEREEARGIAVDSSGNSYITGWTSGDLAGPNQGGRDVLIVKYDSAGSQQWIRQIGTSEDETAYTIAVDGSGNSYVAGQTYGDLGGPSQGAQDAFMVKYDSGGTEQWRRQIGTSEGDEVGGIAVDATGNIYMAGSTGGDLAGPNQGNSDAFIAKYDSGGTEQWVHQIGTSEGDVVRGIAVDGSGNSYITGSTNGDLGGPNQGEHDAFIAKSDSAGTVQWIRQLGSSNGDYALSIAVDGSGNSYVAGETYGDFAGPNQGLKDAFFLACNSDGTVQWVRKIASVDAEVAEGIAVDSGGNIYVTGDRADPWTSNYNVFIAFGVGHATPGDANLDTCPDGLDYVIWSNNYGLSDRWWRHGDFSGDGVVDGLDNVLWSNNYKQNCLGQVPEPSCALLLILGICALRRRRHGA